MNNKTLITEQFLEQKNEFTRTVTTTNSWSDSGRVVISFVNKKGNFKITINERNLFEVFFGLDFSIHRIKENLKYSEDLETLYFLLTNTHLQ